MPLLPMLVLNKRVFSDVAMTATRTSEVIDIGNTSGLYARAFFKHFNFDSVTVAPYMGDDSVKPFLAFEGKWVILLALTSNSGAFDFQTQELKPL